MQITLEKFFNMRYNNRNKGRWNMWFFKKKNKKAEENDVKETKEEVKVETKAGPEVKEEPKKETKTRSSKNNKGEEKPVKEDSSKTDAKAKNNEEKPAKKVASKKEEKTEQTVDSTETEEGKKGSYRVIYSKEDKVWLIKRDGAKRTIASFKTKEQALNRVSELCKNQNAKVIVHKKDGKFQKQTKKI